MNIPIEIQKQVEGSKFSISISSFLSFNLWIV